jgi:hypothetical protein
MSGSIVSMQASITRLDVPRLLDLEVEIKLEGI